MRSVGCSQDRYAAGYWAPTVDELQDVTLLGGYQNDTHTVLRFSRPWITLDTDSDYMLGVRLTLHTAPSSRAVTRRIFLFTSEILASYKLSSLLNMTL